MSVIMEHCSTGRGTSGYSFYYTTLPIDLLRAEILISHDAISQDFLEKVIDEVFLTGMNMEYSINKKSSVVTEDKIKYKISSFYQYISQMTANFNSGADNQIRTDDLRITSALLYQLSHVGIKSMKHKIYYHRYRQFSSPGKNIAKDG